MMLARSQVAKMRAIVCVKRCIDYAQKIRVAKDNKGVEITSAKMSTNPFCEIAIEEGLKLKEKGVVTELVAVCAGGDKGRDSLLGALAMGADRAIHLKTKMRTDQELQPLAVAKCIQKIVEKEGAELVLCGKQSIDSDSNQVGQLLAGMMDWSQGTFASAINFSEDKKTIEVEREVDAGIQKIKISTPAVITADLRLNEPRYATLPNLRNAKKKPFEAIDIESLGVDLNPRMNVTKVEAPPERQGGAKVADVDELIDKLRNTAKVI